MTISGEVGFRSRSTDRVPRYSRRESSRALHGKRSPPFSNHDIVDWKFPLGSCGPYPPSLKLVLTYVDDDSMQTVPIWDISAFE
jgi:hypothetical protein